MKKVIALLTFLLVAIPCKAEILIVDPNGSADYTSIQDCINNSSDGDIIEVRLGIYYENINFYGKEITVTSTDPNVSSVVSNTIIWGNNPAGTVRFETYEDSNSVLTGFTIQSTDTPGQEQGIGVYCYYSSPLISNCVIKNHIAGITGVIASPKLVKNQIKCNIGRGIESCHGLIEMCSIGENGRAGLYGCNGDIRYCTVYGNGESGLIVCDASISNCVIRDNILNGLGSCPNEVCNCTIVNNGDSGLESCHGNIKNCIVTSNGRYGFESCSGLQYNNVWNNGYGSYGAGTIPGISDIHTDPLFADVSNHDYHLKSEIGRWEHISHTWVIDDISSPSIDAGDPCDSTGYEPYPNGDRINQGAYGGTAAASKSPRGQYTYCTDTITGDIDENCKVDFNDLALFASNWSEVGNLEPNIVAGWVATYNGPIDEQDRTRAMAIDCDGNVYVTGDIAVANGTNCGTIKYDSNGDVLWIAEYNSPGYSYDRGFDIEIDSVCNVYVTGWTGTSSTPVDYLTIKYDSNGNELWVAAYDGPGNNDDWSRAIALDNLGNVYVTGSSQTGSTHPTFDFATIKYDPNGTELWVARYNGPGNNYDGATDIDVDESGNILVTGSSEDSGTGRDFATIKYAPDGNEVWAVRYNGPGDGLEDSSYIALDSSSNIYVTGPSEGSGTDSDFATVKYDPNGTEVWVRRYNGSANSYDSATDIALDMSGNILVTGQSKNSSGNPDYATIKYTTDGNELWVAIFNAPGDGWDSPQAIASDAESNIYVTGGGGSYSGSYEDIFTVKYDPNGNLLWIGRYNGSGEGGDWASDIVVDSAGNVYITGESKGLGTSGNYTTIKYSPGYVCTNEITGDFNTDCIVDFLDLKTITDNWLDCNLDPQEACWE